LSGFHLDKDQRIAFPPDKIHFTVAGSHAKIPRDDDDSGTLQVAMCNILTAAPSG
jgi:hypothetical protein